MSCTLFVYQQVSFQSIRFNQIQYKETIKSNYEFIYILKKRLSEDNRLLWWTMTGSNCRHPACKAGALPAELIVHVVTRPGIEPGIPP